MIHTLLINLLLCLILNNTANICAMKRTLEADQEIQTNNDQFLHAAQTGDLPTLIKFIDQGFDINTRNSLGQTALMLATINNHFNIVEALLNCPQLDLLAVDNTNKNAHIHACMRQKDSPIHLLLKEAKKKRDENLRLLEKRQNQHAFISDIDSKLKIPANSNQALNFEQIKTLIKQYLLTQKDCNLNSRDMFGNSLLHIAVININFDLAAWLLSIEPRLIDAKNNAGFTPLQLDISVGGNLNFLVKLLDLNFENELKKAIDSNNVNAIMPLLNNHVNAKYKAVSIEKLLKLQTLESEEILFILLEYLQSSSHKSDFIELCKSLFTKYIHSKTDTAIKIFDYFIGDIDFLNNELLRHIQQKNSKAIELLFHKYDFDNNTKQKALKIIIKNNFKEFFELAKITKFDTDDFLKILIDCGNLDFIDYLLVKNLIDKNTKENLINKINEKKYRIIDSNKRFILGIDNQFSENLNSDEFDVPGETKALIFEELIISYVEDCKNLDDYSAAINKINELRLVSKSFNIHVYNTLKSIKYRLNKSIYFDLKTDLKLTILLSFFGLVDQNSSPEMGSLTYNNLAAAIKNYCKSQMSSFDNDYPALIYAIKLGQKEILNILIDAGADVNLRNNNGDTALMYAINNGDPALIQILIKNGADINLRNNRGETALMHAVNNGDPELTQILIKYGADVNLMNNNGDTALIYTVLSGNSELTQILIDLGANINLSNNNGKTALILALENKKQQIADIIINAVAKANLR